MRGGLILFTAILFLALSGAGRLARAEEQSEPDSFDLLGYFPTKETAGRIKPYQFRASVLWGQVNYQSRNASSDAIVKVPSFQTGVRLEADRWFQVGESNRRPFGVMGDLQKLFVSQFQGISGPPIRYTNASLLIGLRFLGYGHSQPWEPEAALVAGGALEAFPTMLVNWTGTGYNLAVPLTVGPRVGIRARFPLIQRFQMLSLETAGFITFPRKIISGADGTISSGARSIGATALLDFRLGSKLILGGGAYLGWFNLQYVEAGMSAPSAITFTTTSFLSSFRITF